MYKGRDSFIETLEGLGRSENTIKAYDRDISDFFTLYDELTLDNLQSFVVQSNKSPVSIKRQISAIKTYCGYNGIDINFKLVAMPKVPHREKKHITKDIFDSGIGSIVSDGTDKTTYLREQVANVFIVLYHTGLRVDELLSLQPSSLEGNQIRVIGKGNKERIIPATDEVQEVLKDEEFFATLQKVHYNTVLHWTKKYFGTEFSPHSFRHGYTTRIIKNGANEYAVMKVLGHASYQTTLGYFHMGQDEVNETINKALEDE